MFFFTTHLLVNSWLRQRKKCKKLIANGQYLTKTC